MIALDLLSVFVIAGLGFRCGSLIYERFDKCTQSDNRWVKIFAYVILVVALLLIANYDFPALNALRKP